MAFTNVQTKLSKALVTNTAGDYALRTVMDGEQDLNGEYILNEQNAINQDAHGPAFYLDGTNDKIAAAHDADIDITTGDFSMYREVYVPSLTAAITLWEKWEDAGDYWYLQIETTGAITFKTAIATVTKGHYTTAAGLVTAGTNVKIGFVSDRDGTKGQFYVNLLPVTTTETTAMAATSITNTGALNWGFDGATGYSEYEDQYGSLWNLAHSAAEVKDVKNIPFKWQYGSQTDLVTNGDFASAGGGGADPFATWAENVVATSTITDDTVEMHSGAHCAKFTIDASNNVAALNQSFAFETGKEHTVELWAKGTAGGETFYVRSHSAGSYGDDTGSLKSTDLKTLTTSYVKFSYTFIATALDDGLAIVRGDATSSSFYIDDVTTIQLGAVSLYTPDSITANNWFDLAQGNTGAVTGASVLNPDGISTDEDNIPNFSVTSGITADTGSAQGNGVLTASINQIATCANAGDAVTLPAAKPGKVLWVFNDGANASDCFPASGDNIDEAGANTALSVAVDAEVQFICTSAGHWSTITSA